MNESGESHLYSSDSVMIYIMSDERNDRSGCSSLQHQQVPFGRTSRRGGGLTGHRAVSAPGPRCAEVPVSLT